ncbi:MAG: bifunctional precorrin-2 dehydrogenase/sirohydrochlorin ferrochelatase [Acidimicrobiales bacterium]
MPVGLDPAPTYAVTYAVNLLLAGRPVLVVGGGRVAVHKVAGLRRAGARVTVVAPRIEPGLAADEGLTCHRRPYEPGEVAGYHLAIACTDDPAVNAAVAADGEAAGVLVNSADDPANCHFFLPAVAQRPPIQIAVSTGGASPALASWLRRRLEAEIDTGRYAELAAILAEARAELRARTGTSEHGGWADALDRGLAELVAVGDLEGARHQLRHHLGLDGPPPGPDATTPRPLPTRAAGR